MALFLSWPKLLLSVFCVRVRVQSVSLYLVRVLSRLIAHTGESLYPIFWILRPRVRSFAATAVYAHLANNDATIVAPDARILFYPAKDFERRLPIVFATARRIWIECYCRTIFVARFLASHAHFNPNRAFDL